ncbi:MAG: hypothetical protein FWD61_03155 [Phycisphaerales bacterium]|nr:hypothetical protein [Phycisphaerales bacterium]
MQRLHRQYQFDIDTGLILQYHIACIARQESASQSTPGAGCHGRLLFVSPSAPAPGIPLLWYQVLGVRAQWRITLEGRDLELLATPQAFSMPSHAINVCFDSDS